MDRLYGTLANIYSASLHLWQFITLKRPFEEQQSLEDFDQNVWSQNGPQCRPEVSANVPSALQLLLVRAWDHNLSKRPNAVEFEKILRLEISKLKGECPQGT